MLITFIVTVAVLAVLYLVLNICKKKIQRPTYDFMTGEYKPLIVFSHVGFGVSFLVLAAEIALHFFWENQEGLWIIFGFSLAFAAIFLFSLYGLLFTYEAIKGDEVYVRRVFGTKTIKVSDIRSIKKNGTTIIEFYGKEHKRLFFVDSFTPGIGKLIELINEKQAEGMNGDSLNDTFSEERAILEKLGREYRASYKERRKKLIKTFLPVSMAVVVAIVLLLILLYCDTIMVVLIGLLTAFASLFCLFSILSVMKKELNQDDLSLGNQYKFTNRRVKGANRNRFIKISVTCVLFMIMGLLLLLPLIGIFGEKQSYDEFVPITGKIKYVYEQRGRNRYVAIGFSDVPTEYRLTAIYLREFDYSFFDDVEIGDTITIYVSDYDDRGGDKKWNEFYYLASEEKEYFTYDNYVKSVEHNEKVAFTVVGIGIAIFIAATAVLISSYVVCKKREKEEDIIIYK